MCSGGVSIKQCRVPSFLDSTDHSILGLNREAEGAAALCMVPWSGGQGDQSQGPGEQSLLSPGGHRGPYQVLCFCKPGCPWEEPSALATIKVSLGLTSVMLL